MKLRVTAIVGLPIKVTLMQNVTRAEQSLSTSNTPTPTAPSNGYHPYTIRRITYIGTLSVYAVGYELLAITQLRVTVAMVEFENETRRSCRCLCSA